MTFITKLEVLIARQNLTKHEFAAKAGITYRALAYFMSGERKPRKTTLDKIAYALDVAPTLLTNDNFELELTAEEKFFASISANCKGCARSFVATAKRMFTNPSFSDENKNALCDCLTEICNNAVAVSA